jgi:tryptophanyl-tRNA synthetase
MTERFPFPRNGVDLTSEAANLTIPSQTIRPRVLSGMRPTGKLHLGNYMGALANWVKLQNSGDYDCYFFIADWHALTTDYADTSNVEDNIKEVALDWLGAGLDPEQCVLFLQSRVPEHAVLHLIFSMITPISWLERVPTYKEQQENLTGKDLSTYGFLGYPLLQAADILLYQPQYVPVGQDQVVHVELTREIARRFNFFYPKRRPASPFEYAGIEELVKKFPPEAVRKIAPEGKGGHFQPIAQSELKDAMASDNRVLPEPQVLLTPSPKLPGTDGRKMSKSYGNTIQLTDSEAEVRQKLKTMVTDPARIRRSDPGDPDKCPVGDLHKVFSSPEKLVEVYAGCRSAGIGCIQCKGWAADSLVQILAPIQERRARYTAAQAVEIIEAGSVHAQRRAAETMREVNAAMQMPVA